MVAPTNPTVSSVTRPGQHQRLQMLRLRFAARDLPEPDARSRASYALIYHATQSPSHQHPSTLTSSESSNTTASHHHSHHSPRLSHSSSPSPSPSSSSSASSNPPHQQSHHSQHSSSSPTPLLLPLPRPVSPSANPPSAKPASPPTPPSPSSPVPLLMRRRAPSHPPVARRHPIPGSRRPPEPRSPTRVHSSSNLQHSQKSQHTKKNTTRKPKVRFTNHKKSDDEQQKSLNTHSPTSLTPDPHLLRHVFHSVRNPDNSSALRAAHLAPVYVAPTTPTSFVGPDGRTISRSAWSRLGSTETARKNGRDVEFSTWCDLQYDPRQDHVIRVMFFDCTSQDVDKQRLIGTAELRVSAVASAPGKPVVVPLAFTPVSRKDVKRSSKIPSGALVVTGEHLTRKPVKYYLDVQCSPIIRTKHLSSAPIKRVFYAVHGVLDVEEDSDHWTLLYRSEATEMIHRKRAGGSVEYNHFCNRRLMSCPGAIIDDPDAKEDGHKTGGGMMKKALGMKQRDQFFSLPGAQLPLLRDDMRLRLTLYEDGGSLAGFFFIAYTEMSMRELKQRKLGDSSAIRVHANRIGRASLKYVEYSENPEYFCVSLDIENLR